MICDGLSLDPVVAIEVDDLSHLLPERLSRDAFVNAVFAEIGATSRDFVPWRFLDAGSLSVQRVSVSPASKNLHRSGRRAQCCPEFVSLAAIGATNGVRQSGGASSDHHHVVVGQVPAFRTALLEPAPGL